MKPQRLASISLVVLILLSTALLGCSEVTSGKPTPPVDTSISLVDHLGRTVELPAAAAKVIGTHNPSLNMVIVLDGNGSTLAGFGNKDMAYGLYDLVAPDINELTQVGRGRNINMETIMTVKPDLMVLPARFRDLVEQLTEIGVPSLVLDVEKFDSIKSALTLVGKAIGQEQRAQAICAYYDAKISKVSAIAERAATKPKVLMLSGSSKTAVSTDSMLQNLMIETAGGVNVTAGFMSDDLWTEVNMEQIIAWNPDVVYIPAYASYKVAEVVNDPRWAGISAVQNGKVYQFPSKLEPWDYPVAASALGLCWTSHNLHPDLYSFEDLMEDVNEFYQLVYGQTLSAEQLGIR